MTPNHSQEISDRLERRYVQWPLEADYLRELRADASKIIGHAIVCDVRSRDLGGFVEVVAPAALARVLTADVVALFNHDSNQVLGRTPTTLQLSKDHRGLAFALEPANTTAGRDALALVQRGDVRGASFGFKTLKDAWSKDGPTPIRTLLDIEVFEISLTALPMYQQTDVSVALRSMQTHTQPSAQNTQRIASLRNQLRLR